MAISLTCPTCNAAFRVKDEHAGRRGKCPHCQTTVDVPVPETPAPKPSRAARRDAVVASQQLVMQEILEAFDGEVAPVRTTPGYRVALAFVAVAMLLLPALYLALIAAVGFALFYHATENLTEVARARSVWAIVLAYCGPLIAGAVLLFFLVKPLFARRSRRLRLRTLEFGEEPLLFALVTRVARAVGAPEPRRIEVDCQANASAALGSALGGFFGGDLVLTLGLPLVAGLSIQQLAGVLAHELGHFSQGTAMRLTYIVRSVNAWLARIVYERDDWDEALERGCEQENWLALVLLFAKLCVWLTRCVLYLFLALGHGMSCLLLRQMEYDADRNEVRLAGVEAFEDTSRRLVLLSLVTDHALALAQATWYRSGRLPEDLSDLILGLAARVPRATVQKIEKALKKTRTGLFDTHPSHADRLASARRENAPGVFHLDGPATRLFKDFPKLSRAASLDFYRQVIGRGLKRDVLVPAQAILGEAEAGKGR